MNFSRKMARILNNKNSRVRDKKTQIMRKKLKVTSFKTRNSAQTKSPWTMRNRNLMMKIWKDKMTRKKMKLMINPNKRSLNRPSKRLVMMMTNILVRERNKNSSLIVLVKNHSPNPSKKIIRRESTKKDDKFSINTIIYIGIMALIYQFYFKRCPLNRSRLIKAFK